MDSVEGQCRFERSSACWRCQACGYLWLGESPPVRLCRKPTSAMGLAPSARLRFNDLSQGPCVSRGETLRKEPCRLCGHKHESVELFRCRTLQIETSERRYKVEQPRRQTCEGCDYYRPKSAMTETVVAVTTAPRGNPTLERTLRSLKAAGFDRVYVFSDGGEPTLASREARVRNPENAEENRLAPNGANRSGTLASVDAGLPELEIVVRPKRLGAWSNWLLAFQELNLRHPDAARYLIVQDDVLFPKNLAAWLESNVDDSAPVWSLFCAGAHSTNTPGWLNVTPGHAGYAYCGAQAFVIPAAWSLKLLSDPGIVSHKRNPPGKGDPKSHWKGTGEQHVDGAIGRFAVAAGGCVKTYYPSLASHVGETSAIVPGKRLDTINRKEKAFVGETYDLTNPLVACVMLSGGAPERQRYALDAIRDFHAQTYDNRILVIVDNHETPLSDCFDVRCDSRIVYLRTQPAPLGSLRNLGLVAARKAGAALFMPWDDDDRRSPDRIAAQVSATPLGAASLLRSHTVRMEGREDVVRTWGGVNQRLPGYPGLLLAPLCYPVTYKPEQRHEDTRFVAELWKWTRVIGLDLDPSLYVRRIHEHNVSPPEHFERLLGATA